MKLTRLILIAAPMVLMGVAALVHAETATIISPEQAPAPVAKPRDDRIAEQERRRAEAERKRANDERRRREAAEQAAVRLKNDAAETERQRQRAEQERKRAAEERRRREAAEQTMARLKSDAAEVARQRQRVEQERKRAEDERRLRQAAEQTVARLKSDAAESERQRQRAEQEARRADEERSRREAAEQAIARLKSDAAAEAERQRQRTEQEQRRAEDQNANPGGREWRIAGLQAAGPADRAVEGMRVEAARLEAIFAGAELRRDCDVCPRVVAVPPGPLVVASLNIEQRPLGADVRRGASPIRVQSWLAVSRFETTFAEWDRCVAEGGCGGYTPSDNGGGRGSKPVVNVNYADAEAYIRWLNFRAGYKPNDPRRYRLPTEQEWEYAARAGSTTRFFWGDDPNYTEACAWANVPDYSARTAYPLPDTYLFRCSDQSPFSSAVGRYRPNPWGLYDMIGNVSEMVFTQPGADYVIVRGGSWLSERAFHQSAMRGYTRSRDAREHTIGFRVVREVTMPIE